ncbi:MAG: hypothetical protein A4E19_20730 [Nitrospira sp. SG-bin1]|nr:MAG: hypothetical protein A4E19_20730 [Nitrospira sp. SG-bin1]
MCDRTGAFLETQRPLLTGPRTQRLIPLAATVALISLGAQTGCRPTPHAVLSQSSHAPVMMSERVPQDVRRLAVWYPRTSEQELLYGYGRLEQATFQLKTQRSWIKIVERRDIGRLTDEQRWQLSGRVGDDSAVRIGRWLGADSMVLFRIEGPTMRERMLARLYGRMPPFVVSSKIISVESGEVLYHDVVTAMAVPPSGEWGDYESDYELQPAMHAALDHALSVAIMHLTQSFR